MAAGESGKSMQTGEQPVISEQPAMKASGENVLRENNAEYRKTGDREERNNAGEGAHRCDHGASSVEGKRGTHRTA